MNIYGAEMGFKYGAGNKTMNKANMDLTYMELTV